MLATCSFDRTACIWEEQGQCMISFTNISKAAVLVIKLVVTHFSSNEFIYTYILYSEGRYRYSS